MGKRLPNLIEDVVEDFVIHVDADSKDDDDDESWEQQQYDPGPMSI